VPVSVPAPVRICRTASALGAGVVLVRVLGPGAAEAQGLPREQVWVVRRVEGGAGAALSDCLRADWKGVEEAGEVSSPAGWPGLPVPP
jgi:hypothetical protein